MSSTKATHLVLLPMPFWGHVRPLLVLAKRLLLERDNLILTVLVAPTMIDRALSEVATHFEDASIAHLRNRIRVVAAFDTQETDTFKVLGEFVAAYPAAYQILLQEKSITCAKTGKTYDAVPAPTAIVMDLLCFGHLLATREITGNTIPIVAWLSSTAASTILTSGPQRIGGKGDLYVQIEAEAQRTGKTTEEIGDKMIRTTDGSRISIAGIPPMYDYEWFPQEIIFPAPLAPFAKATHLFLKESDGLIVTTSETYENVESVQALRSWLASWNKVTYGVGPLLPIGYGTSSLSSRGDTAIELFLEKSLQQHGEKSVLFISFGTIFWPKNLGYVEELINALIDKSFPFIFCHASPLANIPDELQKKIQSSGLGLLTKWAPQQYILAHKSTGWFLTHGGHGGITEALGSGVPLIGWPFMGDQPLSIAQLVEKKVAIELFEVRTGEHGLKPICRLGDRVPVGRRDAVGREIREVVDLVRGPIGKELTLNAARVKKEIAEAWEEGGAGKKELRAFLAKFVDRTA